MSHEVGVPTLRRAERLPRTGLTTDFGSLWSTYADDPLRTKGYSGGPRIVELTAAQERIAADSEVPVVYERHRVAGARNGSTVLLSSGLDVEVSPYAYNHKIADVDTVPEMNEDQKKGLRKMERIGGMILGIFVDKPVRGSAKQIQRNYDNGRNPADNNEQIIEHTHIRRGVQVGIGLPRLLDRRRSFFGMTDRGLSNRGWALALSALASITLATPWVKSPVEAEKAEQIADDISGGRIHLGEISGKIPNIRIPLPDAGLPRIHNVYDNIHLDYKVDKGDPTVVHKTTKTPGTQPTQTVRLTQFGLGDFKGNPGTHDLEDLDAAIKRQTEIKKVTVSASASDESQQNLASGSCGIGVPDSENVTLADQRAETVINYLKSHGVSVEDIQKLNIDEHVLHEQVGALQDLLNKNNLNIQQACELYNNNKQDQLPDEVRTFFDKELAANRYVEVNFYDGEYRPETTVENTSACTIEDTITEVVDREWSYAYPTMKFDWNGNGLNLKGTSFGIPDSINARLGRSSLRPDQSPATHG